MRSLTAYGSSTAAYRPGSSWRAPRVRFAFSAASRATTTGSMSRTRDAVAVDAVRRGHPGAAVADDGELDEHVVDEGRLVDLGAREPRHPGALAMDDDLGVIAVDLRQRRLREVERVHTPTPTCTFRN